MEKDIIIICVILLILGLSVGYIIRFKKSGKKCIGCPEASNCQQYSKGCSCKENTPFKK